ncbi:hypothetical protein SAMN04487851_11566 [Prevotella sp. tc2-28]|nr:hypothetical protein SAMN04487851_11566 [Prevotella sp. tc2-28]
MTFNRNVCFKKLAFLFFDVGQDLQHFFLHRTTADCMLGVYLQQQKKNA